MEESTEVEVCRSFRNNGRCRFGDSCKFEHSEGEPIEPPAGRQERGECFNWRDSGECAHGDACRFTHGPDDNRTNDISQEICRNFLRGRCNNGEDCPRKHEGTPVEAPARRKGQCFAFRDNGECDRGEDCQFSHGEVQERRTRVRRKKGPGVCFDYRDGTCERGDDCRFTHGEDMGDDDDAPAPVPRRRKKGPGECFDFRDGNCERGDDCRFTHGGVGGGGNGGRSRAPCYAFRDGNCERGDECKFSHNPEDDNNEERQPRAPRVKLDEICNNYKEGRCRLADRCRRIHED